MNKLNLKNHFNFVLVLTILLFLVLGCDGSAYSRGKILDEYGKPIPNAKVILETQNEKFEDKSKENGFYRIGGLVSPFGGKIKITVIKDGYQISEETFNSQSELKDEHNIILKKN